MKAHDASFPAFRPFDSNFRFSAFDPLCFVATVGSACGVSCITGSRLKTGIQSTDNPESRS
jgi:hypothetical protein